MVLDCIRSAHKESPGTCAGFASRENPCCLQLHLQQGVRIQLHRLDFVQGIRKPYSERKWPGALLTTHYQGYPLQPSVRSGNTARVTPSKARPAVLAQCWVEPSSHQHRFLPTSVPLGDLPLQILIQLTLLSLWDLRRWKYVALWLQAVTNDYNVNQILRLPARYWVWDSFPSPAHAVFSPKTATSEGKHAAGGIRLAHRLLVCVSVSNTSSFSVCYMLMIRLWVEWKCLEIFWLQPCHCLFSSVLWFTDLHSLHWIRR